MNYYKLWEKLSVIHKEEKNGKKIPEAAAPEEENNIDNSKSSKAVGDSRHRTLSGVDFKNAFRKIEGKELIALEKANWDAIVRERSKIFKDYVTGQLEQERREAVKTVGYGSRLNYIKQSNR